MCACVRVCVMYIYVCMSERVVVYACMYVCVCVCVYVCVCICVCVLPIIRLTEVIKDDSTTTMTFSG